MRDLAEELNVPTTTVSNWVNTGTRPRRDKLEALSRWGEREFGVKVSIGDLTDEKVGLKWQGSRPAFVEHAAPNQPFDGHPRYIDGGLVDLELCELPILGHVPAGALADMSEEMLGSQVVPKTWRGGIDRCFILRVKGDSMLPTLRDGELQRGVFVNVRRFTSPWIGVAGKPLEGRIAAVDYHANTITLDGPLNEDVTGQAVVVTNDQHHTTYEIVGVYKNGGRSVLHFGRIPMIVGVGKVKEVSNKKMTTSTEFRRWCVEGARHNGRRILDDAKKQLWRIERFDRKQFTLDRTARSLKAGDRFWIGDVGPGDRWSIATVCHVTRRDDGTYDIVKNARMNITIK